MALHFTRDEFAQRQRQATKTIADAKLHGLLIFRQESMYYLTGYDTSGYSMFQAMYFGADGSLALVTRSADERQAHMTSILKDIRIWPDREGENPAVHVRDMLERYGCKGKRIGVEYHAYGLTAQRGKLVDAALEGFCETIDGSDILRLQRLVKTPAELEYVRRAGVLTDEALKVAIRVTKPGAQVNAVYGEMLKAILSADGDPSASRWPMGAGTESMMVRYHTGHEPVGANDQVTLEFSGSYRHYHAPMMNMILTGRVDPRHREMFDACRDALEACRGVLRAGHTVGDVYATHAKVLKKAGYDGHILKVCGYTIGATYPPTWMDFPMIYEGNPQPLEANMVFFMHMIILNSETGLSMSLGETSIVRDGPCEPVCHAPRELIVN